MAGERGNVMRIIDRKTNGKDFEALKGQLKEAAAKEGFAVLHEYDFRNILTSKGMDFDKAAHVFEICKPAKAHEVLTADIVMGVNLPCRIGLFEKEDGCHVIYPDPESMAGDSKAKPTMTEIGSVLERIASSL